MKRQFIFCHGFGFSNAFWTHLLPYFSAETAHFLETPYFAKLPSSDLKASCQGDTAYIGIGHSLGFAKLCQYARTVRMDTIIGINAFTHFLGVDKALRAKRTIEYISFKRQLLQYPHKTLVDFYTRCGINKYDAQLPVLNTDVIKTDLEALRDAYPLATHCKTLIINAADDPIVPPSVTADNFRHSGVAIQLMQNGKHALGFQHAAHIAELIKDFIA